MRIVWKFKRGVRLRMGTLDALVRHVCRHCKGLYYARVVQLWCVVEIVVAYMMTF